MGSNERFLLPGQSSNNQNNMTATDAANSSLAEPYNLQPEAFLSLSASSNSEDDSSNSSSDKSSSSQEAMLKKRKREFSTHQGILDKEQAEQKIESMRKKKAKAPPGKNCSRQMQLNRSLKIIRKSFERAMEEAEMQGYAYGIILEDGGVITGSSQSLRKWWEEMVKFEHNGTAAANRYYMENQLTFDPTGDTKPPAQTYDILMELTDGTLGSVLSAVMQCCDPPQRKFPLEKKVSPPWWPTGNEPWWDQTTIDRNQGQPPYKKPHDLRKMWKAVVVIAVIKHIAPAFGKLARVVKQSKNLQDRMNVREMHAWNSVLKEEMKMYAREHPSISLSNLLELFQAQGSAQSDGSNSSSTYDNIGVIQPQLQLPPLPQPPHQQPSISPPQQQQQHQEVSVLETQLERSPWPSQQSTFRYTCDHPRCLHHNMNFGFSTVELLDQHLSTCGFRNSMGQFGAPVELQPFPPMDFSLSSAPYQYVSPVPFQPMLQAPNSSFHQMAPPPFLEMMLQPPTASYQEMPEAIPEMGLPQQVWSFNNAGGPDYPAVPHLGQDIGPFQSSIHGDGFCNYEGYVGNAGPFM